MDIEKINKWRISWVEKHSILVSAVDKEDAKEIGMSESEENTLESLEITECYIDEE